MAIRPNIKFMAVPKAASMSIEGFCNENDIHIIWHDRKLTSQSRLQCDVLLFVLRNPVDRMLSAYHFLKKGGVNRMDHEEWDRIGARFGTMEAFIRGNLTFAESSQIHFRQAYRWLEETDGTINLGRVEFLDFNNLQGDLDSVCEKYRLKKFQLDHVNKGDRSDEQPLTGDLLRIVKKVYERDYQLIRAVGESRHGGAPLPEIWSWFPDGGPMMPPREPSDEGPARPLTRWLPPS